MIMLTFFLLFNIKKNFLVKLKEFYKDFFKKLKSYEQKKTTIFKSNKLHIKYNKVSGIKKNTIKTLFYKMYTNSSNKNIVLSSFLRKNKIYIKSKFSKARAFTKNIVYFGLIINLIFIVELNLLYYNITINYGYFITPVYILVLIVSIKTVYKYNLLKNTPRNIKKFISML